VDENLSASENSRFSSSEIRRAKCGQLKEYFCMSLLVRSRIQVLATP
jgi:hypothetical protein